MDADTAELLHRLDAEIARWSEWYEVEFSADAGISLANIMCKLIQERDKLQNK